jgi:hypothetical protein
MWAAVIDDLDAAVLRLLHAVGGRDQQVALALGDDLDLGRRDAVLLSWAATDSARRRLRRML